MPNLQYNICLLYFTFYPYNTILNYIFVLEIIKHIHIKLHTEKLPMIRS
jgi:hypothetical protein